jgi:uncharacterized protein (DUF2141 family)
MPLPKPLIALAAALSAAGIAGAAPLTVTVTDIEARGGKVYIGVQTEAQFMRDAGVAGEILDAPDAGTKTFTFDLPEGTYSVSVWHDFNGNGVFDTAADGRPLDGWGAINGETLRAAPEFGQVSIAVPAGGVSTKVKTFYPD